jgi:hypothetical protein
VKIATRTPDDIYREILYGGESVLVNENSSTEEKVAVTLARLAEARRRELLWQELLTAVIHGAVQPPWAHAAVSAAVVQAGDDVDRMERLLNLYRSRQAREAAEG